MDDVLKELDWDSANIALPIANAENKIIEETVFKKTSERTQLQNELSENRGKVNALHDHIKNVKDELMATQSLLNARKNEHETESHIKQIAEREGGRLNQEVTRFLNEMSELNERRRIHENDIFLANQQFESMKSQMKWDQQALEAWLEESAQKDEDAMTLQKYSKQDEGKIKDLVLKIEKLVDQSQIKKKEVDKQTMETLTLQVELDKTAEEFRRTHKDRQELIRQWENIIQQMQRRDNDIDSSAQDLMRLNIEILNNKEELDKKKKFYEDQKSINFQVQREIDQLDQSIADLTLRLNREDTNRLQFQDELSGLKRTVERTGHDLEKARSELAQLKKTITEKRNQAEMLKQGNTELVENLKETVESTLSAEENAKRMEELFLMDKQREMTLNQNMKKRSEFQFKVNQQLFEIKNKERNLKADINGCDATIRSLENRIAKLDHESLKQAEVLYTQDFNIQSLERRLSRLQGEKSNDEQLELKKKIDELKLIKEEKTNQYDILLAQFKRVEDDTRKYKRDIEDLSREKNNLSTKIAELTLHIDTAERLLKKIINKKEDTMVEENLMKLEIKKLRQNLDSKADQCLDLNKRRIQLEMAMKERRGEINIHQDLLKTQLRSFEEDINQISAELQERISKIEKLSKRYDIIMISMAPPEGAPPEENSQAYYVIKSAQEKEELQREGDQLNEQIKKAEKEIVALKNTLQIINSNNSNIKNQNSRVGDQSEQLQQKEELEEQLRAISDNYKHKKNEMRQLQADVKNMEDAYLSMEQDENQYQEMLGEKLKKIALLEKELKDQRDKIERATKSVVTYMRDLRKSKNALEPVLEEKDFKAKDIYNFNTKKIKELVNIAMQYPSLQQTLNILFAQANIVPPSGTTPGSQPSSVRSSRTSSRSGSSVASGQSATKSAVNAVNIGLDLQASSRSSTRSGVSTPKSGASKR